MSSSNLPKLWTEPIKIGHIFRKPSALKINTDRNDFKDSYQLVKHFLGFHALGVQNCFLQLIAIPESQIQELNCTN